MEVRPQCFAQLGERPVMRRIPHSSRLHPPHSRLHHQSKQSNEIIIMHPTINPRLPQSKLLVSFSYSFVFSFAFASSFASSFAFSWPNVRDYANRTSSLLPPPRAPDARHTTASLLHHTPATPRAHVFARAKGREIATWRASGGVRRASGIERRGGIESYVCMDVE